MIGSEKECYVNVGFKVAGGHMMKKKVFVTCFHLCNTLPVKCGGESGQRLKKYSISMIESIRRYFGNDFEIIGGGGIYSQKDIVDYKKAGANHFSLSTVLFNPLKALNLLKYKEKVDIGK